MFISRVTLKRVKVGIFVMVIISFLSSLFVLDPCLTLEIKDGSWCKYLTLRCVKLKILLNHFAYNFCLLF